MILPLPTPESVPARRKARLLERDLKILVTFVCMRCRDCHRHAEKQPFALKTHDVARLARGDIQLCADCRRLLAHALTKRTHCPYDPKPMCKKCPTHCYAPDHRAEIREVMRYSGRRLVLSGRLDYLLHLLF